MLSKLLKPASVLIFISLAGVATQIAVLQQLSDLGDSYLGYWAVIDFVIMGAVTLCFFGGEYSVISSYKNKLDMHRNFSYLLLSMLFYVFLFFPFVAIYIYEKGVTNSVDFIYIFMAGFFSILTMFFCYIARAKDYFVTSSIIERLLWPILFFMIWFLAYLDNFNVFFSVFVATLSSSVISLIVLMKFKLNKEFQVEGAYTFHRLSCLVKDRSARSITFTNVVVFLYDRLDQVVLAAMVDVRTLGYYFICYKVSFFVRFISKPINQLFYSAFLSADAKNVDDTAILVYRNFYINSAVSFLFSCFILLMSDNLLSFFKIQEKIYVDVLCILAISLFFSCLNQVLFGYLNSKLRGDLFLNNALLVIFVQVIASLVMYPFFGIVALAIGKLFATIVGNINALRYAKAAGFIFKPGWVYYFQGAFLFLIFMWRTL